MIDIQRDVSFEFNQKLPATNEHRPETKFVKCRLLQMVIQPLLQVLTYLWLDHRKSAHECKANPNKVKVRHI